MFVIYLNRTVYRTLDDDEKRDNQDYKKWYNGGGMFHNSARIDPTARIEIGALVHAESVVGANVSIGSGCIVGPAVTIGQSTRTGYCDLFILESSIFEIKAYLLSLRFIFLFASWRTLFLGKLLIYMHSFSFIFPSLSAKLHASKLLIGLLELSMCFCSLESFLPHLSTCTMILWFSFFLLLSADVWFQLNGYIFLQLQGCTQ